MKTIASLLIAALAACTGAYAQDTQDAPASADAPAQVTVVLHAGSQHGATHDGYKFNQANPGVALKLQLADDWSVQAGVYKNSYYKTTAYVVGQYTPLHMGRVSVGAFAGLATGYSHVSTANLGRASVVAGLYATVDLDQVTVGLRAVPKISPKTVGVATLELGYKFN
jgi:hypothetical protein